MKLSAPAALAVVLAGCASRVPHPAYSPQPTEALARVTIEPPPGRAERMPPKPAGATAWVDGEWTWRHRRWAWVPGRWVAPPAGVTYSPWCTVRAPDGTLYFAESAWRDAGGHAVAAPKALALAGVEAGSIVDPEGDTERTTVTPPAE